MKDYPSIPGKWRHDVPIHAFDKLDGSNIRAEWNPKKGWYKFGSRTQLLATNSGLLNEARDLVQTKYGEDLARIFREEKYLSAVAFFEFHGPGSIAGYHAEEPHTVTLIDVSPYRHGILPPTEFLRLFGELDVPPVLYRGFIDDDFIESVRAKTLPGITFEGVVCKGKLDRNTDVPAMFKVKTRAWLEKLREFCKGDEALFERLK